MLHERDNIEITFWTLTDNPDNILDISSKYPNIALVYKKSVISLSTFKIYL